MKLIYLLLASAVYSLNFTISGLSSGGFFTHQFHVAYSQAITGAAIIAGGPYDCAMGSLVRVSTACTMNPYLLDVNPLIQFATTAASNGLIDDVKNLGNDKVYIFSGTNDLVVTPGAVKVTEQFYRNFIHNNYQVTTVYNISSGHAFVTDNYGSECWSNYSPWINNCNFDLAGDLLHNIIGNLNPKIPQVPSNLMQFDQSAYGNTSDAGMSSRGWVYIPEYCIQNTCKVHVSFHGCSQSYDLMGLNYLTNIGINEWAEANDIIVIYPQTRVLSYNPDSCWDFWGYTGSNYLYKSSLQMQIVFAMTQNPPYVKWTE